MFDMLKAKSIIKQMEKLSSDVRFELDALTPAEDVLVKTFTASHQVAHAPTSTCVAEASTPLHAMTKAFSFTDRVKPCILCLPDYYNTHEQVLYSLQFTWFLSTSDLLDYDNRIESMQTLQSTLMKILYTLRFGSDTFPYDKSIVLSSAESFRVLLQDLIVLYANEYVPVLPVKNGLPTTLRLVNMQKLVSEYYMSPMNSFLAEISFLFNRQLTFHRGFGVFADVPARTPELLKYSVEVDSILSPEEIDRVQAFMRDGLSMKDATATSAAI